MTIRRMVKGLVAGLMVMALAQPAWALTYQDKQDMSIDNAGIMHVVQTGTVINSSAQDLNLTSGKDVTCGTVPTGKKWFISDVGYQYTGTTTNVRIALLADGVTVDQDGAPTTLEANKFDVNLWLNAAATLKLRAIGATTSDDLYCWVHGIEYDATTAN